MLAPHTEKASAQEERLMGCRNRAQRSLVAVPIVLSLAAQASGQRERAGPRERWNSFSQSAWPATPCAMS